MASAEVRCVWDLGAELGEGPVWVERDRALWFTDIKRQKVYRLDPATGERRSWDAPQMIGFVLPARGGGFVAGLEEGLFRFDEAEGGFTRIAEVEAGLPFNRINDGVVDPSGRLWFGTMDTAEKSRSGHFYRFDGREVVRTPIGRITITNGPAVSPDGRILYHVDTLAGTIDACDIDADGMLGAPRPFVRIEPEHGYPDGPTVDSEGCVWIGLYGGWEARRYSPAGELLRRVAFPVANITKLAFGGEGLRTVYATTARQFLQPSDLEQQPMAGHLFAFDADVPGLPGHEVAL